MSSVEMRPMLGGPLAVDLLNTTYGQGVEAIEWLDFDGAVEEFALSWGHSVPAADVDALRMALIEARRLARSLLEDSSSDTLDPAGKIVSEVNARLASARVIVTPHNDAVDVKVTGDHPRNALVVEALIDAVELRRDRLDRVRSCEHEDCVLWFLDTSKSGRRRWCSMQTCGNRAKAQRHYQRATESNSSS